MKNKDSQELEKKLKYSSESAWDVYSGKQYDKVNEFFRRL